MQIALTKIWLAFIFLLERLRLLVSSTQNRKLTDGHSERIKCFYTSFVVIANKTHLLKKKTLLK